MLRLLPMMRLWDQQICGLEKQPRRGVESASSTPVDQLAENFLVMSIQPDECIGLQFNTKVPGPVIAISGVGMTFKYQDYFDAAPSTGYETLNYDCMIGDAILFQRADGIEAGWRVVQPFLDAWRNAGSNELAIYRAGSEGPEE